MSRQVVNGLALGANLDVHHFYVALWASADALLTCLEVYPYAMVDFWMRVGRAHGLEI